MTLTSLMSLILGLIGLKPPELFALELKKKIAIFYFVYTLASTNINQSAPNSVKIYKHKILDEFYFGSNQTRTTSFLPMN